MLQNLLEVSEKEHYKTLQQLDIVVKALKGITNPTIGDIYNELTDEIDYNLLMDIAQKALKEIDLVGTSVKEEV